MKFALAIFAKRSTENELKIQIKAAYTARAVSEAEAVGIGITLAKKSGRKQTAGSATIAKSARCRNEK